MFLYDYESLPPVAAGSHKCEAHAGHKPINEISRAKYKIDNTYNVLTVKLRAYFKFMLQSDIDLNDILYMCRIIMKISATYHVGTWVVSIPCLFSHHGSFLKFAILNFLPYDAKSNEITKYACIYHNILAILSNCQT